MNTFHLHILAADEMFFEGLCENLVVPCADGSFGVQAHHANMISAVAPGELHYRPPASCTTAPPRAPTPAGKRSPPSRPA